MGIQVALSDPPNATSSPQQIACQIAENPLFLVGNRGNMEGFFAPEIPIFERWDILFKVKEARDCPKISFTLW